MFTLITHSMCIIRSSCRIASERYAAQTEMGAPVRACMTGALLMYSTVLAVLAHSVQGNTRAERRSPSALHRVMPRLDPTPRAPGPEPHPTPQGDSRVQRGRGRCRSDDSAPSSAPTRFTFQPGASPRGAPSEPSPSAPASPPSHRTAGRSAPGWLCGTRGLLHAGTARACALALAGAAALALSGPVQAQTTVTLVSNTAETQNATAVASISAQSFTTGTNVGGYAISKIKIRFGTVFIPRNQTSVVLRNDDSGVPGTLLATFKSPGRIAGGGLRSFTSPDTDGTSVSPETVYWVLIGEGVSSNNRATLVRTDSDNQTGESGWTIANTRLLKQNETDAWATDSSVVSMALEGYGRSAPNAPTNLVAAAGPSSVTLTWDAPSYDGGRPITHYQYRYSTGSTVTPSAMWTGVGLSTEATISSLTDGTRYAFEVRAVNSVGEGAKATAAATPTTFTCAAPDLLGRTEFWTGDLRAGQYIDAMDNLTHYGFSEGLYGALSDKTFQVGENGNSYTIDGVSRGTTPGLSYSLFLSLTAEPAPEDEARLTLHVCDKPFDLDDADSGPNRFSTYQWFNSGLSWTRYDIVKLTLSAIIPNTPATGIPTISGIPQAGETLTARTISISDINGRPSTLTISGYGSMG